MKKKLYSKIYTHVNNLPVCELDVGELVYDVPAGDHKPPLVPGERVQLAKRS